MSSPSSPPSLQDADQKSIDQHFDYLAQLANLAGIQTCEVGDAKRDLDLQSAFDLMHHSQRIRLQVHRLLPCLG